MTTNEIALLDAFISFCEGFARIQPHWGFFYRCFHVLPHKEEKTMDPCDIQVALSPPYDQTVVQLPMGFTLDVFLDSGSKMGTFGFSPQSAELGGVARPQSRPNWLKFGE